MTHRFILAREFPTIFATAFGSVNFIMLNPSTADETTDDPTIRKCIGFAKRWGFERLTVTNLFAYRATQPRDLERMVERDLATAIGADNDRWISGQASLADAVVCAWGDKIPNDRDIQVVANLEGYGLLCIGLTANGNPLHPSRAAYTQAPAAFPRDLAGIARNLRNAAALAETQTPTIFAPQSDAPKETR